ncbi:MAG TPA: phage holin family protein [Gaiellaceae bacterium]|jgi:hypothetical protein
MQRSSANGGIGGAARRVADSARSLIRLELQLAALELKKKVIALGVGIGLAAAALVFGVLMVIFALATVAAVFATFLATWLALLVVTGILLLLALACGVLAVVRLKNGASPVPEAAIHEAKLTTEAIRR